MSLPFIVFQSSLTCTELIPSEVTVHWSLSFGSCSVMTLHVWWRWEFNSPRLSPWIRLEYLIGNTTLKSQGSHVWVFCSFCFLPQTAEKEPLYFRGNFILGAVSASLKSCLFLLQTSSLLGVSNMEYDSIGRRNLWVFKKYIYWKGLLYVSSLSLKALMFHLNIFLFRDHACALSLLVGLWKVEFAQSGGNL